MKTWTAWSIYHVNDMKLTHEVDVRSMVLCMSHSKSYHHSHLMQSFTWLMLPGLTCVCVCIILLPHYIVTYTNWKYKGTKFAADHNTSLLMLLASQTQ